MAVGEKNGKSEAGSEFNLSDFTSTTKLAVDNKNGQYDELYNPFEHRTVDKPNSDLGVLIHLLKGSLGTGILAMPLAFKNGGLIFGMIGTIIIGYVCTHCVDMLVSSSHSACRKAKIPSLGYSETAETIFRIGPEKIKKFSRAAGLFVDWSLIITYYSAATVYVVFIAQSFLGVAVEYQPNAGFVVQHFMLIIYLPLIGLALIRNLKWLIPFSAMANILIVISFVITLYYMFRDGVTIQEDTEYFATEVVGVPLFFATVIFAMEGIGVVMPLENSMKTPQHFLGCPGVLNIAMSCVITLYAIIGFFGYAKFGLDTKPSITLNVEIKEWQGQVVQICIGLAIFCTYGLQFYVPSKLSWDLLKGKIPSKFHFISETLFRIFMVTLNVGVAAAVPQLGPFISLVGAICFSNLGLLIPAILDCACRWDGDLGRYRWRLIKNVIIIIFSLIALVSGSYSSILEMIEGAA